MTQGALTVIARVKAGRRDALAALLTLHDDGDELGFGAAKTVHFARVVILPPAADVRYERLVISTNYDGEEEEHLDDLVAALGDRLSDVLVHCEDYVRAADPIAKKAWLRARSIPSQTFYVGHQGFDRARIVNSAAVRDALEVALDAYRKEGGEVDAKGARALRDELRRRVATAHPELDLTYTPPEGPPWRTLAAELLLYGAPFVAGVAAALPTIAAFLLVHEWLDARATREPFPIDDKSNDAGMHEILLTEDWRPQNPLTHLSTVKPGYFRPFALRLVLFVIQRLAQFGYAKGHLGDMWTIHFARWVLLDDGRMLFFSNYDGSWESYLGDFVDKAAKGLSSIWSNTVGYPATHLLVLGGAKDEEAFKAWTRANQVPTQLWYTAYPRRTVLNVWADDDVVKGLASDDDAEIRAMLRRL